MTFSSFHTNRCKGNKFFHQNYANYQSKLSLIKWSQANKDYSSIFLQRRIFYPIAKDSDRNDGFQTRQKLLSWILLPLAKSVSQENQYWLISGTTRKFLGQGGLLWNKGILIIISSTTHERKARQRKMLEFFLLDTLKTVF